MSYAVSAFLLYAVIRLFYPLITHKVSVGQNFCEEKIVSEFNQEHVFTRTCVCGVVLNHPVYTYMKILIYKIINTYICIYCNVLAFSIARIGSSESGFEKEQNSNLF